MGGTVELKSNLWFWNEQTFSSGGLLQTSLLIEKIEIEGVIPTATAMKRIIDCKKINSSVQISTNTSISTKRKRTDEPALTSNSNDLIMVCFQLLKYIKFALNKN